MYGKWTKQIVSQCVLLLSVSCACFEKRTSLLCNPYITCPYCFKVQAARWLFEFSGANVIKLFTAVSYDFSQLSYIIPGKLFQPSLMFVGEARSLLQSGAPGRCFTRVGSGWFCLNFQVSSWSPCSYQTGSAMSCPTWVSGRNPGSFSSSASTTPVKPPCYIC